MKMNLSVSRIKIFKLNKKTVLLSCLLIAPITTYALDTEQQVKPVIDTGVQITTPVDNTAKQTTPVEDTATQTAPVEDTATQTAPVEDTATQTAPVEDTATQTTSVEAITTQTDLVMSFETGLGYDSNIYHAPKDAYLDYGKTCTVGTDANCALGDDGVGHVQTTPVVRSGAFIPVHFKVAYSNKVDKQNTMISKYKFTGSVYANNKYNNANQFLHRIDIGNHSILDSRKKQKSSFYSGLFIGNKQRLYVDRDTGENQQSIKNNADISARYTYNFFGFEFIHARKMDNLQFDGKLDYISRDYKSISVSEYDNIQLGLAGKLTWRVLNPTKIHAGLETYVVNYDKRPSRNELGKLLSKSPKREYNYTILSSGVRHRLSKHWLVYFDVENKVRVDKNKGYDNYSKLRYKLRLHYRVNEQYKIKLAVSSWQRDYKNAYAFDNFVHGVKKTYKGNSVKLTSLYDFNDTTKLNVSYKLNNQDSSDLRYIYNRSLLSANVKWSF